MNDTKFIKDISHRIPKSDSWNRIAPGKLWSLNDAKYSQNQPLLDKLIQMAPHRLVEASIDGKWGVGAPPLELDDMMRPKYFW